MKIMTVIGARPQFIKAAAVSRAMVRHNKRCLAGTPVMKEILVHTGQHYDDNMSQIFFDELEMVAPDYNLGLGQGRHGAMTGRMLEKVEEAILQEEADLVLVYGDTNSTLAGALAAVKLQVPVAHVEAGLRSFNRRMPEEINRVLTDHAADLLFAPTRAAVENLSHEGIAPDKIHRVGDVMYDAALYYGAKAEKTSQILEKLNLVPTTYILSTVHRAENTDEAPRLKAIFSGLCQVEDEIPIIVPLHPRTRLALEREGMLGPVSQRIHLLEPVGYLDMVMLEKNARLIATDSGGVQKEAFFYRVPCVTLRDETEWVELVEMGWNRVVPPESTEAVAHGVQAGLTAKAGQEALLYGAGQAADKIVDILSSYAEQNAFSDPDSVLCT
jgi:UDP-GlcNAc3NAcA epimerase